MTNNNALTAEKIEAIARLQKASEALVVALDAFGSNREFALAKIKFEEAVMWAAKGVMKA